MQDSIKYYKNFMDSGSHKHDFGISAEWVFLQQTIASLPVMATTRSQAKPTEVFEQSNLRLQRHARFM